MRRRQYLVATSIDDTDCWMNQANYIFDRLQITSEHEKYVLMHRVKFTLRFEKTLEEPPAGYLFICPASDFQVGPLEFRWPQCPAYWSLDESGEEQLSEEEAHLMGFPDMSFTTDIDGSSWQQSAYTAVAKLHRAKGFDPYTQDVARHLKNPLFRVSTERQRPFAHIDDKSEEDFQPEGDTEANDGPGATLVIDVYDDRRLDVELLPIPRDGRRWVEIVRFALILFNTLLLLYGRL
ncbi:hypothetical protein FB45DRAFT_933458 [Roridomyces roridus]|uniref:Uncharacterized protein n=1 Tax=Roridomyces roridus TaxID=1738132 RepID=A0AAD7FD72_9AGAR|nr:hypothetical protein FB45DRAFT_933458 [Roridomyces roridus]